jgi:hypothetical protein
MLFSNKTGFWLRHRGFRFLPLLLATLLLLFLGPVVEVLQFGSKTPFVLLFVVMLAAIETVDTPRYVRIACYALAAVDLVLVFSFELSAHPVIMVAFSLILLGFALIVPVAMIVHIMRQSRVTADLILGALCSYLLLGILFAIFYRVSHDFVPGAFRLSVEASTRMSTFTYFSFTTLSTLGYGDITPVSPGIRQLAILEALTGQIYLAVLVARLVGLQAAQSISDREKGSTP